MNRRKTMTTSWLVAFFFLAEAVQVAPAAEGGSGKAKAGAEKSGKKTSGDKKKGEKKDSEAEGGKEGEKPDGDEPKPESDSAGKPPSAPTGPEGPDVEYVKAGLKDFIQ